MIRGYPKNESVKKHRLKPTFSIVINVTSKAIHDYLEGEDISIQLVEHHNRRVNMTKQDVQTFKAYLSLVWPPIMRNLPQFCGVG